MSTPAFETIVSSLDRPMVVVTTVADGERGGCLVGFHAQSSIEPARYSLWLSKANHTYRLALRATHLGIHFLRRDDLPLAELFGTLSGDQVDKLSLTDTETADDGLPLLVGCPNRMVVRRHALLDEGGDHVCTVTEVVDAHTAGPFEPLLLSHVQHLVPGHETQERPSPPTERGT